MQLTVCLLLALLAYVHGQGCSQQSLTDTQRVTLIMEDNDPGNDGVTTADIVKDVSEHYDINNTTGGMLHATFQQIQEGRLSDFASQTCVDRYLTVEEKVAIHAKLNDHNDDNVVDDTDVEYDYANNYDTDNDGNTTLMEFVKGVVCLYGDDGYFARYFWNIVTGGRGLFTLSNQHFATNKSLPIAELKATQTMRYEAFAASNAEAKDANCINAGHASSVGSYRVIVSGCMLSLAISFVK